MTQMQYFLIDADEAFAQELILYKNYSVTNTTGVTTTGISKVQLDVSQFLELQLLLQYKQLIFHKIQRTLILVHQTQIFLLESTITSTVKVEQVYNRRITLWQYHDHN